MADWVEPGERNQGTLLLVLVVIGTILMVGRVVRSDKRRADCFAVVNANVIDGYCVDLVVFFHDAPWGRPSLDRACRCAC